MSAAPSWPLISPPGGTDLPERDCGRPRVEFRSISRAGRPLQEPKRPEFVLQTTKTQNDVRGAKARPPVRTISSRTAKARNCLSPNGLRRETPPLPPLPAFRAAGPIWDDNSRDSRGKPPSFHTFLCFSCAGLSPLHVSRGNSGTGNQYRNAF